jgi:O-acetyl-ADP-ribose deacetylase (regulator of RNase III)
MSGSGIIPATDRLREARFSMLVTNTPSWAWWFIVFTIMPSIGALALIFMRDKIGPKPVKKVIVGETTIELWVKERKYPSAAEAIIVPVAPDLELKVGIAKWVRDKTANRLQRDAERAAPREPGTVFIGAGGKFAFKFAILAVVMDDAKRTSPEWISSAITRGILQAQEHDVRTIILPDMTEDLLRQPNDITDADRNKTCGPIASAMIDGILSAPDAMETVKIWVWRTVNLPVFVAEMERLQGVPAGKLQAAH